MAHTIKLYIVHNAEPSAGLPFFTEDIEITFKHSNQTDFEKEDFENIAEFFSDYYGGARVYSEEQIKKMQEEEAKFLAQDDIM